MKSFHDGKVILHGGDCMDVLRTLPADSIDAVVTDPPYHLTSIVKRFGGANAAPAKGNDAFIRASRGFMGRLWDGGDIAFRPELWAEVLRVLKPGGHMVCFGGTRTYHRMTCAIEDAGFEIRDAIMWHYGSGFPKSHSVPLAIDKINGASHRAKAFNLKGRGERAAELDTNGREFLPPYEPATESARQWQGYGTALKPATEIICLARKPLSESTVAANVLKHGVGALNIDGCRIQGEGGKEREGEASQNRRYTENGSTNFAATPGPRGGSPIGRWPPNLAHDGSPEVLAGFPDSKGQQGDVRGTEPSRTGDENTVCYGEYGARTPFGKRDDSGSAARFFYSSKADADDRLGSRHPTVKPIDLMQWLVRLVCPKGATCLDPFAGTGTTGAAAFIEGCKAILIEREAEYLADIERRMGMLLSGQDERARKLATPDPHDTLPLFAVTP